jgi:hypothetical protein
MKSSLVLTAFVTSLLAACGGGDEKLPPLFEPQPECEGDPVVAFAGDHQNVISFLEIGKAEDGFDLDGSVDPDCADDEDPCARPDNQMTAVDSLAGPAIMDAIEAYDIMIPIEFYDLPTVGADECVKFSLYLGSYKHDVDTDGDDTTVADGDCDDTRMASKRGNPEIADNLLDDDCDTYADGSPQAPSVNDIDNDLDTFSPADGDCDDSTESGAVSHPGATEVCGDGLDNDCNGVADRGPDGSDPCNPYETEQTIDIDPLSFDDSGKPLIAFTNGKIENGKLTAGPSLFSVSIPTGLGDLELQLTITGAQIEADIAMDGDSVRVSNGRLGGVLDARTMDGIRGLTVEQINLTPEQSFLDATYANILGTIIALPTSDKPGFEGCKTPDIDVDRDGYEAFCDSNPSDDDKVVDICVDGDGTVINDAPGVECTEAKNPDGTYRFVDGVSVELNFATAPAILRETN